jgi:hypothetical protein
MGHTEFISISPAARKEITTSGYNLEGGSASRNNGTSSENTLTIVAPAGSDQPRWEKSQHRDAKSSLPFPFQNKHSN